ncbi:RNA polymerase factor sigma-70 [Gluconacetobacter liquefaciens]|uniref:RNA polymerase sigma-70 factor (ECF subfamily) n=1 Tax=Gluconacetobacter liquefaciens TaxID=89584 RepID=A0A370G3W5_GLULI|nr:sigma-70 family RNA polymerase sigma factor [Gluconacetobacter liquefaciens]MBB2187211.1 sigma-70 family RNA polymerase sigma factor [Gluconacetobacter liquefaciens]RDI36753.1 RNA polymerase sigma-70 factor (ECF subfamily) [Gluconacetobacter liquefaciens]GBQ97689.1 ECF family RNA polymerase sigma factor [Gluconacetobacter liquefaciens NRIC 0522]GEB38439.1 RNA polymerase factor sigma-70 [Gluconacetobacter liquefaciens]
MANDDTLLSVYLDNRLRFLNLAARIVGSRAKAEDIVQDAFVNLSQARRSGTPVASPLAYLTQIVRRLALDHMHSGKVRFEESHTEQVLAALSTEYRTPEDASASRQQLAVIASALDQLPPRTRIAFEMQRFGGYRLHEIAATLDISITRAAQLIAEALKACKHAIDAQKRDGKPSPRP